MIPDSATASHADRLLELKLKIISACNYRCQMCDHWRTRVTRLSTEEATGALADAAGLGAVSAILSGGEPTLHTGLLDIVGAARRLGLRVVLASNGGALASGRLEALLEAGVTQLNISLDSPDQAVHDEMRGVPGSYEEILAGIARAARMGRPVALKTVVSKASFSTLRALPEIADEAPLGSLALTLVTANEPEMLPLTLERPALEAYFFEVLPDLLDAAYARGLRVKVYPMFRALHGLKAAKLARALRKRQPRDFAPELEAFAAGRYGAAFASAEPCDVVRSKALVRPNGDIFFCCEVSHTGDLRLGSIRDPGGLSAAWSSLPYRTLRDGAATPVHPQCVRCTEWFGRAPRRLVELGRPEPRMAT